MKKRNKISKGVLATAVLGTVLTGTYVVSETSLFTNTASALSEEELAKVTETAQEKVGIAESKLTSTTLNTAKNAVKKLPEGEVKTGFEKRLNAVQIEIATIAADKAFADVEKYPTATNLKKVETAINSFPDGDDKEKYKAKFDGAKEKVDAAVLAANVKAAETAVAKAEELLSNSRFVAAERAVDKLPDGNDKEAFGKRLDKVKDDIAAKEKQDKIDKVNTALEKLKTSKTEANAKKVEAAILDIDDANDRKAFYEQFKEVAGDINAENELKEYNQAVKAIEDLTKASQFKSVQAQIDDVVDPVKYFDLVDKFDKAKKAIEDADAVKAIENAKNAVAKAESKLTTSYVKSAQKLVDGLGDAEKKAEFQDRLDKVTDEIAYQASMKDFNAAVKYIEKVEESKKTTYVKSAEKAIEKVQDAGQKETLEKRLQTAKDEIVKAENEKIVSDADKAIVAAEKNQSATYVKKAQDAVNKVTDADKKAEFQKRVDAVDKAVKDAVNAKTIADAEKYVAAAEKTPVQSKVNIAKKAVDLVANEDTKKAFQDRLDAVTKALFDKEQAKLVADAQEAIDNAGKSFAEKDFKKAEEKIAKVAEGDKKAELEAGLKNVKDKVDNKDYYLAKAEIEKADASPTDTNVKNAQKKIDVVTDADQKAELNGLLDAVKKKIADAELAENVAGAEKAIEKFADKKSETYMKSALKAIEKVTDEVKKNELKAKYDGIVKGMEDAKQKELQAEATASVEKAEAKQTTTYVKSAQADIDVLVEGDAKKALQDRLDVVKKALNDKANEVAVAAAEKSLDSAEKTKSSAAIKKAEGDVAKVTNADKKAELQDRLDKVKDDANKKAIDDSVKAAQDAVAKAEKYVSNTYIKLAEKKVADVLDADKKAEFEKALDAVKAKFNQEEEQENYDDAVKAIKKAQDKLTSSLVKDAEKDIAKVKNEDNIKALNALLDKVKSDIAVKDATVAVENAEENPREFYKSLAERLVNDLTDEDAKKALKDRLVAIVIA